MEQTEEMKKKMQEMDDATLKATAEYPTAGTAGDVSRWMNKWYMQAGYKRLSKIIRTMHIQE